MTDEEIKKVTAERVRELRARFGMGQVEFGEFIGLPAKSSQSSISKWESGRAAPSSKAAALLAAKSDKDALYYQGVEPVDENVPAATVRMVPVIGEVQAGAWRESIEWPPDEQYMMPLGPNVPRYEMKGFVVRGTSMDQIWPGDGSVIVYVAGTVVNRLKPKPGDFVLVQRTSEQGLVESTLKQYIVDPHSGETRLWPRSNDPQHQAPITVTAATDPMIVGVVKAEFRTR